MTYMVLDNVKQALERRKDPQQQYVIALDVGTEFVKALIGRAENNRVEIIGVGRQHQQLSDMHSGAIADIAGVVENCEAALSEAEEMAGVSARDSVIGLAGELVKGTTTTIKYKRSEPNQSLEIDELEDIMEQIRERAAERARAQLAWEAGNPDLEVRLVNSALVSVEIDGTKVTNPIGFQGGDVAIQLFTAFAPLVHSGALERVANELDLNLISLSAEPYAVARSVTRSEADNNFSAVLIDVGGGTTDIAVVNDGGVVGTKMFGIGGRAFTNSIAHELDIDFERAEAMKLRSNHFEAKNDKKEKHTMQALERTLDVWIDGITLALEEFDQLEHLPNRILLCGGGASLTSLVDRLREGEWYKELPFSRQPTIKHIQPHEVVDVADTTDTLEDHTFITAMGLLKIGYDTLQVADANESWRDRINAILSI